MKYLPGFMHPVLRNRENFVSCFANIVSCFGRFALCFANSELCFDILCCVLMTLGPFIREKIRRELSV